MENAFSYGIESNTRMQGGDSRYNRLTQNMSYRDVNQDLELEARTKKVTEKISESMNIVANEPSLAFFRIQEHVRKCLPQLAETKHEVQELQQKVQGASFDTEYAANAVKGMHKSTGHFQNIQDLMKNSMFMKQQIDYEHSRREQKKLHPSMYTTTSSPNINISGDRADSPSLSRAETSGLSTAKSSANLSGAKSSTSHAGDRSSAKISGARSSSSLSGARPHVRKSEKRHRRTKRVMSEHIE